MEGVGAVKLTQRQEDRLEPLARASSEPWGEACPSCGRPHLFTYIDGSKVCTKCDEVSVAGWALDSELAHDYSGPMVG